MQVHGKLLGISPLTWCMSLVVACTHAVRLRPVIAGSLTSLDHKYNCCLIDAFWWHSCMCFKLFQYCQGWDGPYESFYGGARCWLFSCWYIIGLLWIISTGKLAMAVTSAPVSNLNTVSLLHNWIFAASMILFLAVNYSGMLCLGILHLRLPLKLTLSSTENYSVPSCDTGGILHLFLKTGFCHTNHTILGLSSGIYVSFLVLFSHRHFYASPLLGSLCGLHLFKAFHITGSFEYLNCWLRTASRSLIDHLFFSLQGEIILHLHMFWEWTLSDSYHQSVANHFLLSILEFTILYQYIYVPIIYVSAASISLQLVSAN